MSRRARICTNPKCKQQYIPAFTGQPCPFCQVVVVGDSLPLLCQGGCGTPIPAGRVCCGSRDCLGVIHSNRAAARSRNRVVHLHDSSALTQARRRGATADALEELARIKAQMGGG
jgi:hypothetical protein